MQVNELVVDEVAGMIDGNAGLVEDASWFVARQPGIVKFLEHRCGAGSETFGVALLGALAIHSAYQMTMGVPPARVQSSLLERAEKAVLTEAEADSCPKDGFLARQPALGELIAGVVAAPPVPLGEQERGLLGRALASVLYALDEMASGRAVP